MLVVTGQREKLLCHKQEQKKKQDKNLSKSNFLLASTIQRLPASSANENSELYSTLVMHEKHLQITQKAADPILPICHKCFP